MAEHHYSPWWDSPEPCPALYIKVTSPKKEEPKEPFVKDQIAAFDTGAPLTAVPKKYKNATRLYPHRRVKVKWPGYPEERVPAYLVEVTAAEYAPRLVEIIYDPIHEEYALIGRNLMKYWYATLKGPEQILKISEPPI